MMNSMMDFSSSQGFVLTLVILISSIVSFLVTNVTSCDPGTDEKNLSRGDYENMARSALQFVQHIEVNEVYLCGKKKGNTFMENIFLSTMSRGYIYFLPCDEKKLKDHSKYTRISKINFADAAGDSVAKHSTYLPTIIQVIQCEEMQTAVKQAQYYSSLTQGRVINIIIGANLPRNTVFDPGIATWYEAHYNQSKQEVVVFESFLFEDSGSALSVHVGSWTKDQLQIFHETGIGPLDFQGHSINVVAFPVLPYVIRAPDCVDQDQPHLVLPSNNCSISQQVQLLDNSSPKVPYTGYLIEVLHTISRVLNFKINLTITKPNNSIFGNLQTNGIATGLAGYLQRKEVCIALAPFTMTKERHDFMDFSQLIDHGSQVLYVRTNSSSQDLGWFTYTSGFHWLCYMALLGLISIFSIGLALIARAQPYEDEHFCLLGNVFFLLFSCLMQQGSWILPRTVLSQYVLILFWFASIVIYAHYSGIIFSSLTVARDTLPFGDLMDAMNNKDWKIGLVKGTTVPDILKATKYKEISNRLETDPSLFVDTDIQGVDRVLNEERFALFHEKPTSEAIINGNCNITQIPGEYLAGYLHLGFLKNLPFSRVIDNEIMKANTGGLLDRLKKLWWGQQSSCQVALPYKPLEINDIFTAFLVMAVAWIISITFLVLEMLHYHYLKARMMHNTDNDVNHIRIETPRKDNITYHSDNYNYFDPDRSIATATSTLSKRTISTPQRELTLRALDEYIMSGQNRNILQITH
ncbi:unnamed protein product [Meganyctiphanes norvegica]|uniref:Ionotropic glutamate receptor C-terminal domain-containing protein n=1 Tax=Meganyctiphanes norvegica TaxID=48144 RepID=A0AAV2RRA4_MEGNR